MARHKDEEVATAVVEAMEGTKIKARYNSTIMTTLDILHGHVLSKGEPWLEATSAKPLFFEVVGGVLMKSVLC